MPKKYIIIKNAEEDNAMAETLKGTTKKVYDYIVEYSNEHGYQPSLREIADVTGIKSASTIFYHIEKLEKSGLVKKSAAKNRAIELTARSHKDKFANKSSAETSNIPVLGKVAAGQPVLAVENISDTIIVSNDLFHGSSLFFLKVKGDSMINAGIFEGDLIAVNKQESANNGDIVVAMLDDEVTVKRFYRETDYIRLQPENDKYEPIKSANISVIGKVVGLIRSVI